MAEFLQTSISDFEQIASSSGFRFSEYRGSVDWENLDKVAVKDIVENVDVKSLSTLVASVLNYNADNMSVTKKIFQFSQLIIDFLLHCKRHSTHKITDKVDFGVLCKLCGKINMDVDFLKYCFRRHMFNSCTYMNSPNDNYVESLKSEILILQNQLKILKSDPQINPSEVHVEKQNLYDCHGVHETKLLYNLLFQQGDNPMQTQEMFWQQKYDNLEKKYHSLKDEIKLNSIKDTIDSDQQCDLYKTDKSSKYVQTEFLIAKNSTLERPPQNIDRCNGEGSSDRDFYELKILRLEAQKNISENSFIEDSYDHLTCDYVDSIKIVMTIGNISRADELFKNTSLMDLIKFDVKELISKRLEEYYSTKDNDLKNDILLEKHSNESNKCSINPLFEDYEKKQDSTPKDDSQTSVELNKTVMSKLKKKVLWFSRVFTSDSPNRNKETK